MTTNFNVLKVMQLKNNNKNENMPEIIQFNIDESNEMNIINQLQSIDVDKAIIEETNLKLEELQKDFVDLCDALKMLNGLALIDEEKLEEIEENVIQTDTIISDTLPILEQAIELKEDADNMYTTFKVVGGVMIGGIVCGGIGAIFGIVPAIIGVGIGSGSGGAVGYLTKFL